MECVRCSMLRNVDHSTFDHSLFPFSLVHVPFRLYFDPKGPTNERFVKLVLTRESESVRMFHISLFLFVLSTSLQISFRINMSFEAMMERAKSADGFLAALDQSGGSTPNALKLYGVPDDVRCASLCSESVSDFTQKNSQSIIY